MFFFFINVSNLPIETLCQRIYFKINEKWEIRFLSGLIRHSKLQEQTNLIYVSQTRGTKFTFCFHLYFSPRLQHDRCYSVNCKNENSNQTHQYSVLSISNHTHPITYANIVFINFFILRNCIGQNIFFFLVKTCRKQYHNST